MKAVAVFPAERRIDLVDHPSPEISSSVDVKLRILEVGLCGTDREISRFEYGTAPEGSDYLILGHESLSEVTDVGVDLKHFRPGDLVATMVRRPCPHDDCPACRAERPDFCVTGDFTERGIKGKHGFMAETVVDDQKYMFVVPPILRSVGVLIEPLSIAEKAFRQFREIQERFPAEVRHDPVEKMGRRHRAVVLGAGTVGILGAMKFVMEGFDTYVYSREPLDSLRAKVVNEIGARYIMSNNVSTSNLAEEVGNIDVVYEATGAPELSFEILAVLGINGIFIFTGIPAEKTPTKIEIDSLMRSLVLKNQTVVGTVNAGPAAFELAVQDLEKFYKRWLGVLQSMISRRSMIENFREALLKPEGIKIALTVP